MRVLVTGATGFVGRALCLALSGRGDDVVALTRSAARARGVLGHGVEIVESRTDEAVFAAVDGVDAVIHLAGAGVLDRRWTRARKELLVSSRVGFAEKIVEGISRAKRRPRVLVSASAVGYYGDTAGRPVDETGPAGDGFLAELCRKWEAAAAAASAFGVRVVTPRIGVVLGVGGGVWDKLARPTELGLGAVLGRGEQYLSWIHIEDLVRLLVRSLDDVRLRGVINAVSPEPVTQREFGLAAGVALGAKVRLRVPEVLLKLGLGEGASAVLADQRVVPGRALATGFSFQHPTIADAMQSLVRSGVTIRRAERLPASEYLGKRGADYVLEQTTFVDAPLADVFEFFASAENLAAMTPSDMSFDIRTATPIEMVEGVEIEYRIALGPLPMPWRTRIDAWQPGDRFVDVQLRGPYRAWWHEHRFEAHGDQTKMVDRVFYRVPLGPLGKLANVLFVAPKLRRVFGFRRAAISMRFRRQEVRLAA